jgi:hypothetical protein
MAERNEETAYFLNTLSIFEVNNPDPIAEPRASVMNVQFPTISFERMKNNGPRVLLTVGAHQFLMKPELAEVLMEELRVASGLCRLAEKEHQTFLNNIASNFASRSPFTDSDKD